MKDNPHTPRGASDDSVARPRVALFVTCLVDLLRPSVGFAAVKLLRDARCDVQVPTAQTCCGQPAYNNGDARSARRIARQVIAAFEDFDYVVAPSGSCAGMLRTHYPALLADDAAWAARATAFAAKVHELLAFLVDVRGVAISDAAFSGTATYHDACAGLRELGVREQPRRLLAGVRGLAIKEMADTQTCCGFGGTFCVKYPELSTRMADDKLGHAAATGADTLLAGDLGCLLHLAGRASRQNQPLRCYHTAEVLAGLADEAGPIAGPPP